MNVFKNIKKCGGPNFLNSLNFSNPADLNNLKHLNNLKSLNTQGLPSPKFSSPDLNFFKNFKKCEPPHFLTFLNRSNLKDSMFVQKLIFDHRRVQSPPIIYIYIYGKILNKNHENPIKLTKNIIILLI